MTKSQLIERLSHLFPYLTQQDSKIVVDTLLERMSSQLFDNGRIEIRAFGSFSLRLRSSRICRNPKTGEKVEVPSKYVIYFKPSVEMKQIISKPSN